MTKMTKLTNQDIFNKALFGIREQNYKQSDNGDSCAYRGNNGTKCAVGHCIDDATAERWDAFEGASSVVSISRRDPEGFKSVFDLEQLQLLKELQSCHDNKLDDYAGFEKEMKSIARRFNLVYTPVNETI